MTAIRCAERCFKSNNGWLGWSFQVASGQCFFWKYSNASTLKPDMAQNVTDLMIGWATGRFNASIYSYQIFKIYDLGLKSCERPDLDGGWTEWAEWTVNGTCRTRKRECKNPRQCGRGTPCRGTDIERSGCNETIDGNWGVWSSWSSCSSSCGKGTQTQKRKCNNPPPNCDGKDCEGPLERNRDCLISECMFYPFCIYTTICNV